MVVYFYRVINLVNEKMYYGVHKTDNIEDGYMGSGVSIRRAIVKYGKDNFQKEILKYFETEELAYQYERCFVTEDLIKQECIYNMTVGGRGGFSHIDSKGVNNPMYDKSSVQKEIQNRPEVRRAKSLKMTQVNNKRYASGYVNPIKGTRNYWDDEVKSEIAKKKMSENHPDVSGPRNTFYNKKHSQISLSKMSQSHKNRARVKCPHCNKIGDISNMTRWHLDNCKHRRD